MRPSKKLETLQQRYEKLRGELSKTGLIQVGTITRRIERRMKFDGAASLDEYIRMIDGDSRLYWRLVSDFFIGVTDFFRDKEIWDLVSEKVLPESQIFSVKRKAR